MKILTLDLGKFKTVACMYEKTDSNRTANEETYHFTTIQTLRHDFTKLIKPAYFVANPNGEAWRWSMIKRKTDRDDALKLARLTAMNQLDGGSA